MRANHSGSSFHRIGPEHLHLAADAPKGAGQHDGKARRRHVEARSAGWRRCAAGGGAWSAPWRCARRRCASGSAALRDAAMSACRSCPGPGATLHCRAVPRRCACAGHATAATSRRRYCRAGSRPSGAARRRCPRPRGGRRRGSRWPRHRRRRRARPGGTAARRPAAPAASARLDRRHAVRLEVGEKGARCRALRSRSRAESSLDATMLTPHSSRASHSLERPADRLVGAGPYHLPPFVA